MNKTLLILFIIFVYNKINCENKNKIIDSSENELKSCEKEPEKYKENTFILKTNLSEKEIEKLLSQNFSSLSNGNRKRQNNKRRNEIEVKQFKSKDNLNKTIMLLEVNNASELSFGQNKKEVNEPYELIDIKENNETKIFLSFDKFFKSQYKEMFDYSYTIIIAFFVLIGMIIYYTLFLPNEAAEISRNAASRPNNNMIQGNINNENGNDNNYILKE